MYTNEQTKRHDVGVKICKKKRKFYVLTSANVCVVKREMFRKDKQSVKYSRCLSLHKLPKNPFVSVCVCVCASIMHSQHYFSFNFYGSCKEQILKNVYVKFLFNFLSCVPSQKVEKLE